LNLGHTFGHALEAATGYSDRLLHGEGVSIGMGLAFELSSRMGQCSQETPSRVCAHLSAMKMKTRLADIDGDLPGADALIDLMAQDKKVVGGVPAFILAREIGDAFVTRDVSLDSRLMMFAPFWMMRSPSVKPRPAGERRDYGTLFLGLTP